MFFGANFVVNWQKLAKNWQKLAFFGVNFIFQKFCLCKKMTNMRYGYGYVKIICFDILDNSENYEYLI